MLGPHGLDARATESGLACQFGRLTPITEKPCRRCGPVTKAPHRRGDERVDGTQTTRSEAVNKAGGQLCVSDRCAAIDNARSRHDDGSHQANVESHCSLARDQARCHSQRSPTAQSFERHHGSRSIHTSGSSGGHTLANTDGIRLNLRMGRVRCFRLMMPGHATMKHARERMLHSTRLQLGPLRQHKVTMKTS